MKHPIQFKVVLVALCILHVIISEQPSSDNNPRRIYTPAASGHIVSPSTLANLTDQRNTEDKDITGPLELINTTKTEPSARSIPNTTKKPERQTLGKISQDASCVDEGSSGIGSKLTQGNSLENHKHIIQTTEKTNSGIDKIDRSAQLGTPSRSELYPWYIDDIQLFRTVSKVIGQTYSPCLEQVYVYTSSNALLHCSCDVETCGVANSCCPDVDQSFINTDNPGAPKCQHAFSSLYTEDTFKAMKHIFRGHNCHTNVETEHKRDHTFPAYSNTINKVSDLNGTRSVKTIETPDAADQHAYDVIECTSPPNTQQNTKDIEDEISYIRTKLERLKDVFPIYLVTYTCNDSFKSVDIVNKCLYTNISDTESYIPVIGSPGNRIYKNKYCSQCNYVQFSHRMSIESDCLFFYTLQTFPSNVTEVFKMARNCVLTFDLSKWYLKNTVCYPKETLLDGKIISQCNVTGAWLKYNSVVEELCQERDYMPQYKEQVDGTHNATYYKNLFCYICNKEGDTKTTIDHKAKTPSMSLGIISLYIILFFLNNNQSYYM